MIKTFLFCFSLLFVFSIYSQQKENKKSFISQVPLIALQSSIKLYAYTLGATLATTYAHEYGHALAAKLLLQSPAQVIVNPHWNPFLISGNTTYLTVDDHRRALVALAGPVAGLTACWMMLKCSTFLNCYLEKRKKMKAIELTDEPNSTKVLILKEAWSILTALNKAVSTKSLINPYQPLEFQIGVLCASAGQVNALIPHESNDGNSITKSLWGKSFYKEAPDFWDKMQRNASFACFLPGYLWALSTHLCKTVRSALKMGLVVTEKGQEPYAHLTLKEARTKLAIWQSKHFFAKSKTQGKILLLKEHIADLE